MKSRYSLGSFNCRGATRDAAWRMLINFPHWPPGLSFSNTPFFLLPLAFDEEPGNRNGVIQLQATHWTWLLSTYLVAALFVTWCRATLQPPSLNALSMRSRYHRSVHCTIICVGWSEQYRLHLHRRDTHHHNSNVASCTSRSSRFFSSCAYLGWCSMHRSVQFDWACKSGRAYGTNIRYGATYCHPSLAFDGRIWHGTSSGTLEHLRSCRKEPYGKWLSWACREKHSQVNLVHQGMGIPRTCPVSGSVGAMQYLTSKMDESVQHFTQPSGWETKDQRSTRPWGYE
jgi:hypothetical protein